MDGIRTYSHQEQISQMVDAGRYSCSLACVAGICRFPKLRNFFIGSSFVFFAVAGVMTYRQYVRQHAQTPLAAPVHTVVVLTPITSDDVP